MHDHSYRECLLLAKVHTAHQCNGIAWHRQQNIIFGRIIIAAELPSTKPTYRMFLLLTLVAGVAVDSVPRRKMHGWDALD